MAVEGEMGSDPVAGALERQIAAGLREGRIEALDDFHRLFHPSLVAQLRRLLGEHGDDAEDVAQEVALSVWGGRQGYEPARGTLRGWVSVIARNAASDHHRRAVRSAPTEPGEVAALCDACEQHELDANLGTTSSVADLLELTRRLPQRCRQVIFLRYGFDLTADEIARVLGCSRGAVDEACHEALPLLERRLARRFQQRNPRGPSMPSSLAARPSRARLHAATTRA
jgi:RNA polymerase sigma-70 factor (ECF subfamily)